MKREYWKFGCNWGKHQPVYYEEIKKRKIVLGTDREGIYGFNDLILVTTGHTVRAIARIISEPIKLSENSRLEKLLEAKFNVYSDYIIHYYHVEFYELSQEELFQYKLQQGIRIVQKEDIINKSEQLWTENMADTRLMRITWNDNGWEKPTIHDWKKSRQGNHSIAHENQYGYGHEEWLFNSVFNIKGYQYGYIRGADYMEKDKVFIDKVYLFTINPASQDRLLIGVLNNVEIIENYEAEQDFIAPYIIEYKDQMVEDLKSVNADYKRFLKFPHKPNVKFRLEEAELYPAFKLINELKQGKNSAKYNRFQAYKIQGDIAGVLEEAKVINTHFQFNSGKAKSSQKYLKSSNSKKTTVNRTHSNITESLYTFLSEKIKVSKNDLSVEKTRIGYAIADCVVREMENTYTVFEIKTKASAQLNIREALGQLFEYAFIDNTVNIKKLVIVGPAKCKKHELEYLDNINSLIKVQIEYWAYQSDTNDFIIQ